MENRGLIQTEFQNLQLLSRGKVRDIYEVGEHLLIVASDRISAFDVIMPNPIPRKGEILTKMSLFWFDKMKDLIPNHIVATSPEQYPASCRPYADDLRNRSMLVKKAKTLPVECVVRGYLSGSGWKDYTQTGIVSGVLLPDGLKESSRLPEPIFTPSSKAPAGEHDQPMTRSQMEEIVGSDLAGKIVKVSLDIYRRAFTIADKAGIIIADTKFEFGLVGGELILIDELLTPDSSRFWPKDEYEPGRPQRSFDKQFLRDYLLSLTWNQKAPAPELPDDIIRKTAEKYEEALKRLVR